MLAEQLHFVYTEPDHALRNEALVFYVLLTLALLSGHLRALFTGEKNRHFYQVEPSLLQHRRGNLPF